MAEIALQDDASTPHVRGSVANEDVFIYLCNVYTESLKLLEILVVPREFKAFLPRDLPHSKFQI